MKTMLEMKQQTNCTGTLFWLLTILFSYIGVRLIMKYKDKVLSMKKDKLLTDILRTIFITSIVIFLLMACFMAIAFIFFDKWRINFDLTPTLTVMALTTVSADIVRIIIKHTNAPLHDRMFPNY